MLDSVWGASVILVMQLYNGCFSEQSATIFTLNVFRLPHPSQTTLRHFMLDHNVNL